MSLGVGGLPSLSTGSSFVNGEGGGPNSSHEAQWREICVVRTDALPHAGHEQAISPLPLPFR